MNKRLQLVALLLSLALSVEPLLADSFCGQRACDNHPAMQCCRPTGHSSMPMSMDCAQPYVSAPTRCAGDDCCMLSPAAAPSLVSPVLLGTNSGGVLVLAAIVHSLAATHTAKRPPGPHIFLPTPRYLLFRVFRI